MREFRHTAGSAPLRSQEEPLARMLWGASSLFSSNAKLGVLVCGALGVGVVAYASLRDILGPLGLVTALALLLTTPVAIAKTATACGINALGTFARYEIPIVSRVKDALLYMTTAVVTAAVIGLATGIVGNSSAPRRG